MFSSPVPRRPGCRAGPAALTWPRQRVDPAVHPHAYRLPDADQDDDQDDEEKRKKAHGNSFPVHRRTALRGMPDPAETYTAPHPCRHGRPGAHLPVANDATLPQP